MASIIRPLFGPRGISGVANRDLTPQLALCVGQAAGIHFRNGGERRHTALVAKDTRLSGYMIEPSVVAGLTSAGMDVDITGPLPTAGLAALTRSMRADVGIMITGVDEPFDHSGLMLFGADGLSLLSAEQEEIETLAVADLSRQLAEPRDMGKARRIDHAQGRYHELVKQTVPRPLSFSGVRVVVDCANGATHKVAPDTLRELGFDVVKIGCEPDGLNINDDYGPQALGNLQRKVHDTRADVGIALGGDGTSVAVVDREGVRVPDEVVAHCATSPVIAELALTGDGLVRALGVICAARSEDCSIAELVVRLTSAAAKVA